MRALVLALILSVGSAAAYAQKTIRQVDFKNFTYPLSHNLLGKSQLQWLDESPGPVHSQPIRLVSGKDAQGEAVFTLQSVTYAPLGSDTHDEAIVTLRYDTGSVQTVHYVYVYSLASGKPKLLGFCHSGSGGHSALAEAYGEHGQIVIDQFEPKKPGAIAPRTVLRTRFDWKEGHFQQAAPPEHAQPRQP